MQNVNTLSKNSTMYINALFILLVITTMVLGQLLIWNIPYTFPFGGPDELMHLSMADYISKHLSWPRWDSLEVVRNDYGVSYNAGGSIVYWLHGLSYRLFGHHRIGAFLLLLLYLALTIVLYRKNILAGFLLLAGLFPQTLFIFSYVNSDSGTVVTAVLLGMSVGAFISGKANIKSFLMLFFFAGLAVTARQHLWAIALITLIWAVIYKRKAIYQYDKKIWLWAVFIALIPASWWFITSFVANDGDILGVFTNAKSIVKFGKPDLLSTAIPWDDILLYDFWYGTMTSLYAKWGWLRLGLHDYQYVFISGIAVLIALLVYKNTEKKIFLFFLGLLAANFGFMLLYSVVYDYQPQGRYLFPSVYIILGIISTVLIKKKVFSKTLLSLLIILAVFNTYYSVKLTLYSYMDFFIEKPVLSKQVSEEYYKHGYFVIDRLQISEGKLEFRGWAFDRKTNKPFEDIQLMLKNNNKFYKVELESESRPDVVSLVKNSALRSSGFTTRLVDLMPLEKGVYKYLLRVDIDGNPMFLDINKSLNR